MVRDRSYEIIELTDEWIKEKYRGFLPLGNDHILGLRYFPPEFKNRGGKFVVDLMTEQGPRTHDLPQAGESMSVLKAGWPHHTPGVFGYWHINEEDEIYLPLPLVNGDLLIILLEGMPRTGRWDRFVQYCRRCSAKLYEKAVKTGDVGIAGFWKAEEDAVNEFNCELALRTCRNCGDLHPLAYHYFRALKPGAAAQVDDTMLW